MTGLPKIICKTIYVFEYDYSVGRYIFYNACSHVFVNNTRETDIYMYN